MTKVYFRADGNSEIGLGHIIRSCALANMLREHFDCTFFVRNPNDYMRQEIMRSGCQIVALSSAIGYNQEAEEWSMVLTGNEIVVLDGYHFETRYQECLKQAGCKLVCIDDIHACYFLADVVINHAGSALEANYETAEYTRLCLGFDYALLRDCFLNVHMNCSGVLRKENNVLICLGGADPSNDTLSLMQTIGAKYPHLHYDIVIGGAYKYKKPLTSHLRTSSFDFTIHEKLDAGAMLQLMQKSSKAICAPSSVSIEYLVTGGELYLKKIADNQQDIYNYYITNGLGFDVNDFIRPSADFNKQLAAKIFDGGQKGRLTAVFKNLI